MKYIYPIIILSCSMILGGCIYNDKSTSLVSQTSGLQSIHKKYPLGIMFVSGDISMSYTNQQRIMGSVQYPDQKNIIVLEGYGKGIIRENNIYRIPGLYGNIIFSGRNIIYGSGFSFLGPSTDSERSYTRTYVWPEKKYRESISFMNGNSHEYGEVTALPQLFPSENESDRDKLLEGLCGKNDDMNPITKEEYKAIGTGKIYIAYRDNGGMDHKTIIICFMRKDNGYKLEWTDNIYRKDIVESFKFL